MTSSSHRDNIIDVGPYKAVTISADPQSEQTKRALQQHKRTNNNILIIMDPITEAQQMVCSQLAETMGDDQSSVDILLDTMKKLQIIDDKRCDEIKAKQRRSTAEEVLQILLRHMVEVAERKEKLKCGRTVMAMMFITEGRRMLQSVFDVEEEEEQKEEEEEEEEEEHKEEEEEEE